MPREAFKATDKQIKEVTKLASYGLKDEDIASFLEVSESTIKKYFAEYLKLGRAKGKGDLAGAAMRMALSGMYPAMTIFMCKVRLGWKDNYEAEEPKDKGLKRYTVELIPKSTRNDS